MWTSFLLGVTGTLTPHATPVGDLPLVLVTEDDTVLDRSARIRIPEGTVIRDENRNGAIHVTASGVELHFEPGSVLRGAPPDQDPDRHAGTGLRIHGQNNVRVVGLRVRGYKTGIHASQCDGLELSGADVSDNFAQRLASTPEVCDDGADWLACHDNDGGEWRLRYGAGISIESSHGVTVRNSRARRTQNGLLLDRVSGSRIFDNDFSFLSGWGLGLWRSSKNVVSHNAFDFCIRGYSHGKYNRGQDSAGILVFEQCSDNVFAYNSATHGGDGVFGFAGREALGERVPAPEGFDATGLGNNRNLFLGNDLSYAAAHGLEMTFSFDNLVLENRFVGNAICGVWGGYSQSTLIAKNHFQANGDAGYGKERGGVNIEHSVRNRIAQNHFEGNACGVHLWWDEDLALLETPWAQANETGCVGNEVIRNRFTGDQVAVELRACEPVLVMQNEMDGVGTEVLAPSESILLEPLPEHLPIPEPPGDYPGELRAVGARAHLAGRENIVMGTWGPWDHESPFLQLLGRAGGGHAYALRRFPTDLQPVLKGEGLTLERLAGDPPTLRVVPTGKGFFPYTLRVGESSASGVVQRMGWQVACFPFDGDPRTEEAVWRRTARAAKPQERDSLNLPFASGGPAGLGFDGVPGDRRDHFGTHATAQVPLVAGTYEVQTMSDDGIRVWVDDVAVIDNWTWHAPTRESAPFTLETDRTVSLRVEHFELDGYSILDVSLRPLR